ncbi:hypothetical protein BKI52_05985 [marine bacterium AO1-C]|nr:hypothetical protein BKI52_05985 [marine bacterium AO1-C]
MYRNYFCLMIVGCLLSLTTNSFAQIIPPPIISRDTPAEAQSVSIGSCDINFPIDATFDNSAIGGTTPCLGTAIGTIQEDAWAKFTTPATAGDFVVRYTNTDNDAVILVYDDNASNPNNLVGCVNNLTTGMECLTVTLSANTNYWIRVLNVGSTEGMDGVLCVFRKYASDTQTIAATAPAISLGSCNVPFDTDGTSTALDAGIGCNITPSLNGHLDSWVRFDATAGQNINIEYQSDEAANSPAIILYLDDGSITDADRVACYDGSGQAYGKIDYSVTTTGAYYLRILNMNGSSAMTGSLCLYEKSTKVTGDCSNAEANKLVSGDCNLQMNVPGGNFRPAIHSSLTAIGCTSDAILSEAWAAFDGVTGTTYTILYNNDNNNATEALDVGVVIYQKNTGTCASPAGFTEVFCANKLGEGIEKITFTPTVDDTYFIRIVSINAAIDLGGIFGTLCFYQGPEISDDLCSTSSTIGVGTCGQPFNITTGFINNEGRVAPMACSGATVTTTTANYTDGWKNFVALQNRTRIEYRSTNAQDVVLEVYTGDCNALSLLACTNAVSGIGSEVIEINTTPDQTYFIRVINITNTADLEGQICINNVLVDDACNSSDTKEIQVGACNQRIDILSTYDTGTGNASGFGSTCSGSSTIAKDVWFKFTGNGGNVTLQYENLETTSNPLIEVYTQESSICPTNTIPAVGCANDCNTSAIQTETVTINNTINGRTYFVRIANLDETQMTGYLCIYNSSAVPPLIVANRLPGNTCATATGIDVGDCGLRINLPVSASCVSSSTHFTNSGVALGGSCAALTPDADGWMSFTAVAGEQYTIEYDNNNQLAASSNDVALAAYDGSSVLCTSISATEMIACVNDLLGNDNKGVEKLTFTAPNSGKVYIRIMNVSGNSTSTYGKLCLYSGDSKAANLCTNATVFNVGDLDQQFNIQNSFTLDTPPAAGITNCVFATGSNAAQKDGWAQFTTSLTADTISVVYNNDDGDSVIELDPDVNNAAVVVYEGSPCGSSSPVIVGCANVVGEGSESLTFAAKPLTTYYVRVMSTRFSSTMQGRLSIFAFKKCELGDEQVRDGDFTNFPKNSVELGTTFRYTRANLHRAQRQHVFATQYGYRQHTGNIWEMGGPAHYGVATSAYKLYHHFFSYGYGFNGWGGQNNAYCSPGGKGVGTDACPNIPAPPETNNAANHLVVDGLRTRSKIWCQTIPMPAGTNRYFVFSGWFNSLIPSDRSNLDDPQIRVTVCEGRGLYDPNMSATDNETAGNLPGVTLTYDQANNSGMYTGTHAISTEEQSADVMHRPAHPGIRGGRRGRPWGPYGAAMNCNPANLKVINSDVFLPEAPDNWQAMQCIYKVPDGVTHVNLCLENISATHIGNDFGIDVLSFRQCLNGASIGSDLERVSCELGTDPTVLGIPLNAQMIHFDGKLQDKNVFLNWVISAETNVRVYEVQRAISGGKFQTIGKVTAQGGNGEPLVYDFVDRDLPLGQQFVYYRLNVVNYDGTHGFSPIVDIEIASINKLGAKLSPNPIKAGQASQLTFNAPKVGSAIISVINLMGVVVRSQPIATSKGYNSVSIDTQGLKAGIYLIKLNTTHIQESKRLVIVD